MRILAYPGLNARHLNPYTWLLYSRMDALVNDFSWPKAVMGHYDILHFHWPEFLYSRTGTRFAKPLARALVALLDRARARGSKVIWTAHNIVPHDCRVPEVDSWFWAEFVRRIDLFISLSQAGVDAVLQRYPILSGIPRAVIPHGHYRGEYPSDSAVDARRILRVPPGAEVLLFFGKMRPYKGILELIRSFSETHRENALLYLVGQPAERAFGAEVRRAAALDQRVRVELSHVSHENTQYYFRAADAVVLPYRNILNSGTAMLALSFDRPVLVPERGAMPELQAQVGTEWVRTFAGDLSGEELQATLHWANQTARPDTVNLDYLDWSRLAARTKEVFERLLGGLQ